MLLDTYGYTDSCPGCDVRRSGLSIHKNHNEACRHRVEGELGQDQRGKDARDRADARWKHWASKKADEDEDIKKEETAEPEEETAMPEKDTKEEAEDIPIPEDAEDLQEEAEGQGRAKSSGGCKQKRSKMFVAGRVDKVILPVIGTTP